MYRNRYISLLLIAGMLAPSVISGWGHSHAHSALGSGHQLVRGGCHHHHALEGLQQPLESQEHEPLSNYPVDKDDCSVCRHLALAAILTFDLTLLVHGDVVEFVEDRESFVFSHAAASLYRPRAPPELS